MINGVFVRWNKNLYKKWRLVFEIELWKIYRTNTDNMNEESVGDIIDTLEGLVAEDTRVYVSKESRWYQAEDIVMKIPEELYLVFDDLSLWYPYLSSWSYTTSRTV